MQKLLTNFKFHLSFWFTFAMFGVANIYSYPMSRSFRLSPKIGLLDDGFARGFPFAFYFDWSPDIVVVWFDLFANVAIAVVCSFLVAILIIRFTSRNPARLL